MSMWRLPTKRDALDASDGNPTHRCDSCPRRVPVDMLADMRNLPASLRGDAVYLCDACTSRLVRTGRIAREDMARLAGAPSDVVSAIQAWALSHDPIRKTKPVIPLPTP